MFTSRKRITQVAIASAAILSKSLGLTLPAAHAADTTSATAGVASAPAGVLLVANTTPDFITHVHNRLKLFRISALKMIIHIFEARYRNTIELHIPLYETRFENAHPPITNLSLGRPSPHAWR